MPGKEISDICVDCKDAEAFATIRNRRLCGPCLVSYAKHKAVRSMVQYRAPRNTVKDHQHTLLLPLSFGTSSSVLLHMLNEQTERQVAGHLGRAAYNLHILVVEPSTISPSSPSCQARLDFIRELYPRHKYSMIPFHSIFQYDSDITNSIQQLGGPGYVDDETKSHSERLDNLRASILTATSKDDIDNLLLIRLVVAFAKQHGCEAVTWGDSDSRLAAKTLANVAKGRGASLTWQVCDGPSPWGLHFCFPLRGLYRSELQLYVNQVPELENMVIIPESPKAEISNRNLSIDELMNQYILTQGEKYPGVMANVVRTVNKLQPASNLASTTKCVLCAAPLRLGTDPTASGADVDAPGEDSHGQLCHGCTRARADFIGPGNR